MRSAITLGLLAFFVEGCGTKQVTKEPERYEAFSDQVSANSNVAWYGNETDANAVTADANLIVSNGLGSAAAYTSPTDNDVVATVPKPRPKPKPRPLDD